AQDHAQLAQFLTPSITRDHHLHAIGQRAKKLVKDDIQELAFLEYTDSLLRALTGRKRLANIAEAVAVNGLNRAARLTLDHFCRQFDDFALQHGQANRLERHIARVQVIAEGVEPDRDFRQSRL